MQILSLKKALDFINDDSNIFENTKLGIPKKISISKTKKLQTKNFLGLREALQILLNLQSAIEAIEVFKQRNR